MPKTVLVLTPHPDDAEFYAGGTLAKMAAAGDHVIIAIATDGRCGSYEYDSDTLASLRAEEAYRAAGVLGAEKPILLGHADMGLDLLPPGVLREQFVRLIRQYKPDVVITEGATSLHLAHPDHRQVAWAARDAIGCAQLPLVYPEHLREGLQPHFVSEKYFYQEDEQGCNKVVDISGFLDTKLAALAAHTSQMKFLLEDILVQARAAGLAMEGLVSQAMADPSAGMAFFITTQAEQVGRAAGFEYGEAFRYERYHPVVETFLGAKA